jgi:hypothetical protein
MATPEMTKLPRTSGEPVIVVICPDPTTKQIRVFPETFWISKSKKEEVLWICKQDHNHGPKSCFSVHFEEESPFENRKFHDDWAMSGGPVVTPHPTKLYKYTVFVDGYPPLDPRGGVKP